MWFWSKICHDTFFIICWINKDDLDDSIFNVPCDKFVPYVHMFQVSVVSSVLGHEYNHYIINMTITESLILTFTLCNSWSTNVAWFTVSDAATPSALKLNYAMICWALDLWLISTKTRGASSSVRISNMTTINDKNKLQWLFTSMARFNPEIQTFCVQNILYQFISLHAATLEVSMTLDSSLTAFDYLEMNSLLEKTASQHLNSISLHLWSNPLTWGSHATWFLSSVEYHLLTSLPTFPKDEVILAMPLYSSEWINLTNYPPLCQQAHAFSNDQWYPWLSQDDSQSNFIYTYDNNDNSLFRLFL